MNERKETKRTSEKNETNKRTNETMFAGYKDMTAAVAAAAAVLAAATPQQQNLLLDVRGMGKKSKKFRNSLKNRKINEKQTSQRHLKSAKPRIFEKLHKNTYFDGVMVY